MAKRRGMVPYGYRREGDAWAIDADQAAVVRRIFAEFTGLYAHAGLTEIADRVEC